MTRCGSVARTADDPVRFGGTHRGRLGAVRWRAPQMTRWRPTWMRGSTVRPIRPRRPVPFAVGFGLFAAFLFAASASLQQHAARQGPPTGTDAEGRFEKRTAIFGALAHLIRRLVRSPLWLVGWFTNLFGFVIQAVALHFG